MGNCCVNHETLVLNSLTKKDITDVTYDFTRAKVIDVYDGDTITIAALYDGLYRRFTVRLYGVDCAEIRGGTNESKQQAQNAKRFVENAILNKVVEVNVLNNKIYQGKKIHEKYGRLLAIISTPDGRDLAGMLLAAGLAMEYYGDKKPTH